MLPLSGSDPGKLLGCRLEEFSKRRVPASPFENRASQANPIRPPGQLKHRRRTRGLCNSHHLWLSSRVGVGHRFGSRLQNQLTLVGHRSAGFCARHPQCRDSIGPFDLIREGRMHQHSHADRGFIHPVTQALEDGVVVVEAGEHPPERPKHAPFGRFRWIAQRRSVRIAIQVIQQATAVAVVQAGSRELLAVFHICGTSETEFAPGLQWLQHIQDGSFLRFREITGVFDERADRGQVRRHSAHIRRVRMSFEPLCQGRSECPAIGQDLFQKVHPEIEGERQ